MGVGLLAEGKILVVQSSIARRVCTVELHPRREKHRPKDPAALSQKMTGRNRRRRERKLFSLSGSTELSDDGNSCGKPQQHLPAHMRPLRITHRKVIPWSDLAVFGSA